MRFKPTFGVGRYEVYDGDVKIGEVEKGHERYPWANYLVWRAYWIDGQSIKDSDGPGARRRNFNTRKEAAAALQERVDRLRGLGVD